MAELFSFVLSLAQECPRAARLLCELEVQLRAENQECSISLPDWEFGWDGVLELAPRIDFPDSFLEGLDPDGFITRSTIPRPVYLRLEVERKEDKLFLTANRKDESREFPRQELTDENLVEWAERLHKALWS